MSLGGIFSLESSLKRLRIESRTEYMVLRERENSFASEVIAPWTWQARLFSRRSNLSEGDSFV